MAKELKSLKGAKLKNIILSSNPCPSCKEAAQQPAKTKTDWKKSKWGLTDSKKRYCNLKAHNCHCILVPEQLLKEFPEIDKRIKLRGDPQTDIKAIVEVGPNEDRLRALMDRYNFEIGKLPDEIYDMPLEEVADYLEGLLRAGPGAPGAPPALPGAPWSPGKSGAEAKKYAKKNIIQTGGKVDYRNMAIESINVMNKELSSLVEKFKIRPTYIGTWKGFRSYAAELFGERWQYYRRQFRMPTNAWASYMEVVVGDRRVTAIIVRDEWWTEAGLKKLKDSMKRCVETGFHKYQAAEDIFHHEYAHFLDHTLGITRQPMFREKYMELVRAGTVKDKISGYAYGDLSGEAWAELYANYKNGYYLRTNQTEMQLYVETIVKFIEARTR